MEAEVGELTGAGTLARREPQGPTQRSAKDHDRFRNAQDRVPEIRWTPSCPPSFLRPNSPNVPELIDIVQKACIGGMTTMTIRGQFVDGKAAGLSKNSVSRICEGIDGEARKFQDRRLDENGWIWVYLTKTQRCHLEQFMEFDWTAKKHLDGIPAFFESGGHVERPAGGRQRYDPRHAE